MKRLYIFHIALAVLAVASCQKPLEPEDKPSEGQLETISLEANQEMISKATLSFPEVHWQETDHLAVFDGTGMRDFTVKSCSGKSAVFTGSVSSEATSLIAVYPYSAAVSAADGTVSLTLPAQQSIGAGACIDPSALLAVSSASVGQALQFRNVCGLLMLSVDRDDITEVVLAASNGEAIAGTVEVNASTGEIQKTSAAQSTVSVKPASGTFAQGDYYIPILPCSLSAGFKVSALTSGGTNGMRETSSANSVARNHMLKNIKLSDIEWSTQILTLEQLKAWVSANDGSSVTLGADITIDNSWTPSALSGGKLYGNGHSISGFVKDATGAGAYGLFSSVENCTFEDLVLSGFNLTSTDQFLGGLAGTAKNSSFKNVSFDGKLQCTAKVSWSGRGTVTTDANNFGVTGGLVGLAEGCNFENCTYSGVLASFGKCTGGICGYCKDSSIKGCSTVIGCEVYCYYHCAGLIAGATTGNSVIEDCSAEGFVGCLGYHTGGISGWFENGLIRHCVVGSHSYISSTQYDVGGITGHMQANAGGKAVVDRCTVYANVQGQYNVGGIVGYTCQKAAGTLAVTNCAYLGGDLYATGINSNYYALAGGIAGWNQNTLGTVIFENNVSRPGLIKTSVTREKRVTPDTSTYKNIGGVAGLIGFSNGDSTTKLSNCYTSITKPEILVSYKSIDSYASVFQYWGAFYGKTNTALQYGADNYRDADTQSGMGTPASTAGEVGLSVQQMTDGTLLGMLNANASKCTAAGVEAESWIAGEFGYPVPASVIDDPNPRESETKRVSVCGDSISTFSGYIPATYAYHYPCSTTDHSYCECVRNVSQTYWYQVIYDHMKNARLDLNMSYSGSAVAHSTNTSKSDQHWYTQCYVQRYLRQGGIGNPDVILLHGGTNDWAHNDNRLYTNSSMCKTAAPPSDAEMEEMFAIADAASTREEIEALDDTTFCTAYIKLVKLWIDQYPGVKIVCIIGDYLSEGVEQSILKIADHYGAKCVDLLQVNGFNDQTYMPKHDYNGSSGCHPGVQAMRFISEKIYSELGPWMESGSFNKTAESDFEQFDMLESFSM